MKRSSQKANIFLIHAHSDKESVYKLYQRLVGDGLNVWLDIERLKPGQDWQSEIRDALLKCDLVLVCLSRAFDKQQGYRHEELKLALEKANFLPDDEVFIIPVRLEKCEMPASLRHLHRVDLFKPSGYKNLVNALKGDFEV
ncbi:MAG TPA: toll/interleukin-1 receptor domain-containing protein [Anaerolineales bacterium]|nr:toll/interleukin-1 receptor domain-containing protein [Anaerolineales bacterium]